MITGEVRRVEDVNNSTTTISIEKVFKDRLPFIGDSQDPVAFELKMAGEGWKGVRCTHSAHCPSPHLTGSHIESAAHVLGDGIGVAQVFTQNPHYKGSIQAYHVKVTAQEMQVAGVGHRKDEIKTLIFACGDSYEMIGNDDSGFGLERVVTKAALAQAMGDVTGIAAVLIEFEGEEESIANWPYLTNDACAYLVEKGVKVVGLNIPSMDRERDGGMSSNHKVLFKDPNCLIVESLSLKDAPRGRVSLELRPKKFGEFLDVVACEPIITTNVLGRFAL